MGLKLTLSKDNNPMGFTFEDAYWVIEELKYEMGAENLSISFNLNCYPSRDSSKLTGRNVEPLSFGSPERPKYNGKLYGFSHLNYAKVIFPDGVPMDRDAQLTQIYNFIKEYTGLPFEDVFEDAAAEVGPAHEEPEIVTDPEPEPVEDPEPEAAPEVEPEPEQDPVVETEEPQEEPAAEEPSPEPESDPEPETYHNPLSL